MLKIENEDVGGFICIGWYLKKKKLRLGYDIFLLIWYKIDESLMNIIL